MHLTHGMDGFRLFNLKLQRIKVKPAAALSQLGRTVFCWPRRRIRIRDAAFTAAPIAHFSKALRTLLDQSRTGDKQLLQWQAQKFII